MRITTILAAVAGMMLLAGSTLAQETTKPAGKNHVPFLHRAEKMGLNLTDEQKAKITEIVKARRQQVKAALTADQLKQFQDARGQGREARIAAHQAVRASLSADQKAKIHQIRRDARQQIKAALTPEQIDQIKAWRQARGQKQGAKAAA
jgi:Spy/CpxP family protein refolding chaperone